MIVGHGDIASVIPDQPDRLFFASGVSNSAETSEGAYARECGLLLEQDRNAHLVYFSSLSIFYAQGRYQQHKRFIENIIRGQWRLYTIVRLGTITWGKNPHLLINHLRAQHAAGLPLDIQPVRRHVINEQDFQYWLNVIPDYSCEMNITGQLMTVEEIVEEYVTWSTNDMADRAALAEMADIYAH